MSRPTYNLRVFYYHDAEEGDWIFSFREVWYDAEGAIVKIARVPFSPLGESAGELEEQIQLMQGALKLSRLSTDLMGTVDLV